MAHLRKGGLIHHYCYHYITGLRKLSDRVPLVTIDSAYANTIKTKIVGIVMELLFFFFNPRVDTPEVYVRVSTLCGFIQQLTVYYSNIWQIVLKTARTS